uniref:Uncharacterized protein n=1 Tax=Globisporangium ultimum (strain ATCC 200006 / CBS 805.95 / DAOM BR144) TaxID=431595 RepID=K3W9C2_GLOUD
MADEERFMSKRGVMDAKERGGSPRRSEAEEFDAKAAKQVDGGEMDEEDSTVLSNDEKAPPRRVSVGWGTESAAASSDEKGVSGGDGSASATLSSDSGKRGGRRARRGSDNASNFGGGDGKNKNRYFDDDGDSTDIQEIPDLEEEEREPDITAQSTLASLSSFAEWSIML